MAASLNTAQPSLNTTQPISPVTMVPRNGTSVNEEQPASEVEKSQSNIPTSNPSSSTLQPQKGSFTDSLSLSREAEQIRQLQMRDQEVRSHEAAHAAVGGMYTGHPTYQYQRGSDGRNYAVGGEVSIDVSPVPGDPEATLQKAEQIRAAALAPAQPSAADMKIAQRAQMMATEARMELAQEQSEALTSIHGLTVDEGGESQSSSDVDSESYISENELSQSSAFAVYA